MLKGSSADAWLQIERVQWGIPLQADLAKRRSAFAARSMTKSSLPVTVGRRGCSNPAEGPWVVLMDWVDGYKHYIEVRRSQARLEGWKSIEPSWMDILMWAVLTGEAPLVRTLWSRTSDPLRAAMMASQLYRKLSSLPHLRADQPVLRRQAVCRLIPGVASTHR